MTRATGTTPGTACEATAATPIDTGLANPFRSQKRDEA